MIEGCRMQDVRYRMEDARYRMRMLVKFLTPYALSLTPSIERLNDVRVNGDNRSYS